jgi:hypothetical protein
MKVFENHLGVNLKSTDLSGTGEILDLLNRGEVGALTTFLYVWGTGGAAGKKNVLAEMKHGLFCPEGAIVHCCCIGLRSVNE